MTLPKTHPLYGARNVLVDALYFLGIGSNRTKIEGIAETFIKDLESAGYRVVGPEPTEEMLQRMHQKIDWCRDGQRTNTYDHESQTKLIGGKRGGTTCKQDLLDAWRAGIFASPTITGTEKSDE